MSCYGKNQAHITRSIPCPQSPPPQYIKHESNYIHACSMQESTEADQKGQATTRTTPTQGLYYIVQKRKPHRHSSELTQSDSLHVLIITLSCYSSYSGNMQHKQQLWRTHYMQVPHSLASLHAGFDCDFSCIRCTRGCLRFTHTHMSHHATGWIFTELA